MIIQELLSHTHELIALALLLGCSAFFSGSETALFSLTRADIRNLEESDSRSAALILSMLRSPQGLLSAVLLGNTVVNVLFFTVSFLLTLRLAEVSRAAAAVSSVVSLFAVILIGEVSPKGIAVGRPMRVAALVAPVLFVFHRVMHPFSAMLRKLAVGVTGLLSAHLPHMPYVTREELKMLAGMAEQQGVLDRETRNRIQRVVELTGIRAREVMTPRVDMPLFNLEEPREALCRMIRQAHEERVFVYEDSMDQVLGWVASRDVFLRADVPVRDLLRPVRFVPETQLVESLLRQFRKMDTPVAVVVDEYGGTAGLVDAEHIFEEIFGDIRQEFEPVEELAQQLDDGSYLLGGELSTRAWSEVLGESFDAPGVDTVGGLVTALLGRIPEVGDSVAWRGLWFTVEAMDERRVALVRIESQDDEEGGRS